MANDINFYKSILDDLHDGVYFVDRDMVITYWSKGAEEISGYKASEIVGTKCADSVLMHVDEHGTHLCEEGCQLAKTVADGVPREQEMYIHHKNGHRVPILAHASPLREQDGEIAGGVETFSDNSAKLTSIQRIGELEELVYIDSLTELSNRRHAGIMLHAKFDEMRRYNWSFGVILMDIDHFKNVNDEYGHEIGDKTLKMVAQTLLKSARSFDIVARWGGEEFLSIVVNVDENELYSIAERFRILVEQSNLAVESGVIQVTISVGATIARPDDTEAALMRRTDQLMYRSKAAGRNRVLMDL